MQNQHTRELIGARNTSHIYNNEDLSTCVTYFEQYFIVRVLCQPNHFQHIVTVRVSGVRADNTLTALIVSSCIAGLLILLAILGGVIFCVLRFVTLGPPPRKLRALVYDILRVRCRKAMLEVCPQHRAINWVWVLCGLLLLCDGGNDVMGAISTICFNSISGTAPQKWRGEGCTLRLPARSRTLGRGGRRLSISSVRMLSTQHTTGLLARTTCEFSTHRSKKRP